MRKHSVDLNSDMGEGFGPWTIGDGVDEQIMLISSANIATGFHAGDPNIMARTVQLARDAGVGIARTGLSRSRRLRPPHDRRNAAGARQRHPAARRAARSRA